MLGAITTKLGTLTYYDKVSSEQKLQVCKQQQTASGNKNLYIFVYVCNLPMLGSLTTKLGTQMYHDKFSSKKKIQVCK